jgi:hypothetical protein
VNTNLLRCSRRGVRPSATTIASRWAGALLFSPPLDAPRLARLRALICPDGELPVGRIDARREHLHLSVIVRPLGTPSRLE